MLIDSGSKKVSDRGWENLKRSKIKVRSPLKESNKSFWPCGASSQLVVLGSLVAIISKRRTETTSMFM